MRSTGRSSGLASLLSAASLDGAAAALEAAATPGLLPGSGRIGVSASVTERGAFEGWNSSSQAIAPTAPARTRAETLVVQVPERRPAAEPTLFGP